MKTLETRLLKLVMLTLVTSKPRASKASISLANPPGLCSPNTFTKNSFPSTWATSTCGCKKEKTKGNTIGRCYFNIILAGTTVCPSGPTTSKDKFKPDTGSYKRFFPWLSYLVITCLIRDPKVVNGLVFEYSQDRNRISWPCLLKIGA